MELVRLLKKILKEYIYLSDGNALDITCVGKCKLDNGDTITNVLCIPECKHNLLLVSKLTKDLKCVVTFFPDLCVMQDLFSEIVRGIGREVDGLYNIQLSIKKEGSVKTISANLINNNIVDKAGDVKIWHRRLRHTPIKVLHQIPTLKVKRDCHDIQNCTIYQLARKTRLPFLSNSNRSTDNFSTIHGDVWGPYRVTSHDGCRFFLTLVDDYSKMTWVYMLRMKSDVIVILR